VLVKPLPQVATGSELVGLGGEFYCLGSKHTYGDALFMLMGMGTPACACCMIFSPRTNCWRAAPPLREARYSPSACACNGKLYVFGGLKLCEDEVTSSECYDPKTKRWTMLPQIPVTTHGAHAVVIGVSIYLLGGASMDWPSPLDFIQVFDTVAREWTVLRTVVPVRSCFALGYGSKIICLGGSDSCPPNDARGLRNKREEAAAYMRNKAAAGSKKKASKAKAKSTPQWLPDNPILEPGYEEKFEAALEAQQAEQDRAKKDKDPRCTPQSLGNRDGHSTATWCLDTETMEWTQMASAPKLHYPARGYFWLDGHVVRAAEDGKLNFNIESNTWEDDPGRKPTRHHEGGSNPAVQYVPF